MSSTSFTLLTAISIILLIASEVDKNDELKNDARSLFHYFSPFFVNLTQLFCQFSIIVQESNNVGEFISVFKQPTSSVFFRLKVFQ